MAVAVEILIGVEKDAVPLSLVAFIVAGAIGRSLIRSRCVRRRGSAPIAT